MLVFPLVLFGRAWKFFVGAGTGRHEVTAVIGGACWNGAHNPNMQPRRRRSGCSTRSGKPRTC
jgi:hypothetical protein